MSWGIPIGFRPSPSTQFFIFYKTSFRYCFTFLSLIEILNASRIDYPGGGPSFTSSGVVVGTWNTSVSRMG